MYQDHFSTFAFPLSDFQKHAIEAIVDGHHILVCAPTGSGKTLPAEFAIRHFTQLGKKVIYTSPIKALSNQKFYEFSRKFPELQIGLCTGDIKTNPTADVIIMTAEILNNRLFHITGEKETSSSSLDFQMDLETELAAVIMDEVHYINDEARGHVWEQTILTLPPQVQMIMLSATLDGPENFAKWIESTRSGDSHHIESTRSGDSHRIESTQYQKQVRLAFTNHRIVPLTHYAFVPSTESFLKTLKDKALQQTIRQSTNTLIQLQTEKGVFQDAGYKQLKHVLDVYENSDVRLTRKYTLNHLATVLKGSDDMDIDDSMLPAIVFVFSRKQVEKCAEEITANILPFDSKIPYTIAKECEQLVRRLPNYKEYLELPEYQSLIKLLEKGVAIHHSGMIPILREIVELMISKKYVYLLFATESFAIGLDCPIRTAVFSGLSKFDGSQDRFLLAHEYTQMAGRAGRRGIDTVGHVVHLPTLFRNGIPLKDTYQKILSGKPQTLVSKFHVDYGMILRLLKKGIMCDFAHFADRSMVYEELVKKTAAQQKHVSSLESALKMPFLRASLEQCEEYLRLESALKTAVNKKRKLVDHSIQQLLAENRFIKEDAVLVAEYRKKQEALEQEKVYATGLDTYLETQTNIVCRILLDYGYIVFDVETGMYSLSPLGEMAAQIAEAHPLVMAKCLQEWSSFAEFSVQQIVGFLACFVDVKVPEEYRAEHPKSKDTFLQNRVSQMHSMILRFEQEELDVRADTGIAYANLVQFDLIDAFMEWTKCEDERTCKVFLQNLSNSEKAVSAGDFTKAGMKICALAKELEKAVGNTCVEAQHKLSQIDGLVMKYITTTQSLYL
jgi:superfamily II RNA helicase